MAEGSHFKNRFIHYSAADCPISVKFCVGKQPFTEFRQWNRCIPAFYRTYFCFPNAVWASASGGFHIVSDTLVI